MIRSRPGCFLLVSTFVLALAPPFVRAAEEAQREIPASSLPALDLAAAYLEDGRLDMARTEFSHIAADASRLAFERGLARLGLAETCLAGKDVAAAIATWTTMANDTTLPAAQRTMARVRIARTKRIAQGLPGHDAAAHRVRLPTLPDAAVVFHVSPDGDDRGKGTAARPFRSLTAARDAVRAWRKSGKTRRPGRVEVRVRRGEYSLDVPLQLGADDSGTAMSPVVYAAAPGARPVFHGGVRVRTWSPVADPALRARLDPSVRARVVQADLKPLGVRDLGDATKLRACPELFVNGEPQTLARWPDQGFVKTGEILGTDTFKVWNSIPGCRDGKFRFVEERPARWTDEPDVRLYGYWFWDWFEEFQTVTSVDADARAFTLAKPYSRYGYRKDQRYYAVNVFRELDRPGEWYLDRQRGLVFWLPPDGTDVARATVVLSVFKEPCVVLDDAEHVILRGLTFQECRGDGVHVRGGRDVLVAGCTFRRLGGDAVVVTGGRHHGVFGCTMHTLGCGGMGVTGGDRQTLTPGEHFVENCTVFDISRLKRTYTPAVRLDGCGNRVAHNRFERIPSSAMRIEGNDQLIELNVIRHVVQESDDQGGVDMYGNPLYRGVVIRWNRWSDIVGGTHCGAAGVRLDDMISGVTVHGNVFTRCGAVQFGGVQIHGGKENLIDGNVFLDCFAGISFSRWPVARYLQSIAKFLPRASSPPYAARYPDLARLKESPNVSFICRNVFAGGGAMFLRDGNVQRTAANVTSEQPLEMGQLSDEAKIRADPRLRRALLDAIPVDDMGPYDHPWRAAVDGD